MRPTKRSRGLRNRSRAGIHSTPLKAVFALSRHVHPRLASLVCSARMVPALRHLPLLIQTPMLQARTLSDFNKA